MTPTYYELLGLPRTVSFDDVKHAFRREIAKYHPDKVQHLGPEFEEIAASKAAVLTQAYKTLGDPAARAEYDARIGEGTQDAAASHPAQTDQSAPASRVTDPTTGTRPAEVKAQNIPAPSPPAPE